MYKYLLVLLVFIPLAGFNQLTNEEVTAPDGTYIPFLRFLPADYLTGSHPVIIYLSGQGETRNSGRTQIDSSQLKKLKNNGIPKLLVNGATMEFNVKGQDYSFIVLAPQKYSQTYMHPRLGLVETPWEDIYVEEMIKYAKTLPGANSNQIFITGLSLGAGGAWDYPASSVTNASKILGIAPVSGIPNISAKSPTRCNIKTGGTDIFAFHGFGDPYIHIDSVMEALTYVKDTCTGTAVDVRLKAFTEYGINGHDSRTWDAAYDTSHKYSDTTMYEWMIMRTLVAAGPLPVEMVFLKGKNLAEINILTWATDREVNFQKFEIFRSQDGKEFAYIGSVNALLSNQQTKEYTFKDTKAPKGLSHYKIKQIDKDGSFKYSKVISIENQNRSYSFEKYPNPVKDDLNFTIEGNLFGAIEISILDLKGNLVKKMTARKDQASWKGFIDVSSLSKGMYMLQLKASDGKKEVSSFIKN